jgi:palmitoyltransferase
MTTNESGKWSDFQLDIADGYIYRRPLPHDRKRDYRSEPAVRGWPKTADHIYMRTYEDAPSLTAELPGDGAWTRDFTIRDVENVYDMGFMASIFDVFFPRKYLMAYLGLEVDLED